MKNVLLLCIAFFFAFVLSNQRLQAQSVFFSETFSSGDFTANGWTFDAVQGNWAVGSSYTPTGSTAPNAYFNWSPSWTNYSFALVSPVFQAGNATSLTLDYNLYLNNYSTSTLEQFSVEYKTTAMGSWSLLENFTNQSGTFNVARVNQLLFGMDGQDFQIRFRAYGVNSYNLNGWGLDNIVVKGMPTSAPSVPLLFAPNDLAVDVPLNQPLQFSIPFGTDGIRITMGTNSPNYNNLLNDADIGLVSQYLATLSNSTTYGWRVRAYNTFGNSNYSSTRTFTTIAPGCFNFAYCPTTFAGGVNYDGIQQVHFAGINNYSGAWASDYTDYRSLSPAQVSLGQTYRLTLLAGNYSNNYAYFDWNQDGDFGDTGETYTLPATSNNNSISTDIAVPAGATLGTTAFRIRTSYYNYADPCNTQFNYGEAEDYCLQVAAAPSCGLPIVSSTNTVSASSVQILFSGSFNEIQVETAAFDQPQGAGTITSTTTNTATLTGLTGSTHYRLYYRGRCGASFGAWTGPYFFSPSNTCTGAATLIPGTGTCAPLTIYQPFNFESASTVCFSGPLTTFFQFTSGTTPLAIEVTGNNTNSSYYISLFDGNCTALSSIICDNFYGNSTFLYYTGSLVPGQTYYIGVSSYYQGEGSGFGFDICLREDPRSCTFTLSPDFTEAEPCGTDDNSSCYTAEIINLNASPQFVIQGQLAYHPADYDYYDNLVLHVTTPAIYTIQVTSGMQTYADFYSLITNDLCNGTDTYLGNFNIGADCSNDQLTNISLTPGSYVFYIYANGDDEYPCLSTGLNTYQIVLTSTGCGAPSLSNILPSATEVTADITASLGSTNSLWQIVPAGNAAGVGIVAQGSATGSTFTASGLTAGTAYWIYVSSACGAVNSSTGGPYAFNTSCALSSGNPLPFQQNFNALPSASSNGNGVLISTASECWQFNDALVQTGTNDVMNDDYGVTGVTLSTINYGDCRISDLTGTIDLSNIVGQTNISVSFDLGFIDNYNSDPEDRVFIRGSSADAWIELFNWAQYFSDNAPYGEIHTINDIDLDSVLSTAGQNFSASFQIKFSINSCYYAYASYGYEGITIDNVIISTCPFPSNAGLVTLNSSSATINWDQGSSGNFDVYISTDPNFLPDQATVPTTSSINDTVHTFLSLTPATGYYAFVRRNCGSGDYSNWAGPIIFTTTCPALTAATLPIIENFDLFADSTFTEDADIFCQGSNKWSYENPSGEGGLYCGANAYNGNLNTDAVTFATVVSDGFYSENNLIWTVNMSNYIGNSEILLSFDYESVGEESDSFDRVYVRGSSSDVWIETFNWSLFPSSINQALIDVDSVLSANSQSFSSSFQVRWRQYDNYTPGTDGITLDNVSLIVSACGTEPNTLTADVDSYNSATVSWTVTGSEALWDIYVTGFSGANPGAGTTPSYNDVNTNPFQITGLSGNATFKVFVRAQCGGTVTSNWAGPLYITVNDSCVHAIPITQTINESFQSFVERDAGADGGLCGGTVTTLSKEVWFVFTPTTSSVELDFTTSTSYPISFEILQGTCGTFTNVCCVASPSNTTNLTHVLTGLSIGTPYYIHLGINPALTNPTIGVSVANVSSFSACSFETTTPDYTETEPCEQTINNTCATGEPITIGAGGYYIHGSSTNNCTDNDEDWYLFTVPATTLYQFSALAQFQSVMTIYLLSSGCGSPAQVASNTQNSPCLANTLSLNLTPGNYAVRIANNATFNQKRHACGVRDKYELKITVNCAGLVASINASPSQTICANQAPITLTANPSGAASYLWNTGATTESIQTNSSGIFSVTITDAGGCTGNSSISVTVNSNPSVTASSNSPLCEGNTLNLTSTSATSYNWSGPDGFTSIQQNPSITNASSLNAGTYTVVVTNTAGCTSSSSTTVTLNTQPLDLGETQPIVIPAGPYAYYPFNGNATDASGNNRNGTVNGATSVADRFGNAGAALSITTGNNVALDVLGGQNGAFAVSFWFRTNQSSTGGGHWWSGVPLVDAEVCGISTDWGTSLMSSGRVAFGLGSGDITITSSSGGYNNNAWHHVVAQRNASGTMQLYVDNVLQASGSGPATPRTVNAFAGSNPCNGATYNGSMDEVIFYDRILSVSEITDIYSTSINPLGLTYTNNGICSGGTFSASLVNSQPGVNYQFVDAGTLAPVGTSVTGNGGSISLMSNSFTSDIDLTIRATLGGCTLILDSIIPVVITPSSINADISPSGSTTFCTGGSVQLTATGAGITSYFWSTGATTASITVTTGGTYSVTVNDAGGCSENVSEPVTVNPNPSISFSPNGPLSFCPGGSVTTTVRPNGAGFSFLWSDGNTDSTRIFSTANTYSVIVTNPNGCSNNASIVVNQSAVPNISASNNGPFCGGYSLTLTGSGSGFTTANWTGPNGFTASTATAIRNPVSLSDAGYYTLVVSNAAGCTDTDSTLVEINGNAPVITYSGNSNFTSHVVYPLIDNPYEIFRFEATYSDPDGDMPFPGYPKVLMDYEPNGSYFNTNDRLFTMIESDPTDTDVTDGKQYYYTTTGLPTGTGWATTIRALDPGLCQTDFGPSSEPDVLDDADISIFANNIWFSDPNPEPLDTLIVYASVQNPSDYPAENFYVHLFNQFDSLTIYPDQFVTYLAPHSSITVQWAIVTPAVPSWNPMQVFIDYTNVIPEPNELDNQAIRPFINGAYNLPGGIEINGGVSPYVSTAVAGNNVNIIGNAYYVGTPIPLPDPSVAGATVTYTLLETGATFSTYTNNAGNFNLNLYTPVSVGIYHVAISVTDFTLTGYDTVTFELIPPVCIPELGLEFELDSTYFWYNGSTGGTVTVYNNGCQNVNVPTTVHFTATNGAPVPADFTVPPLIVGASYTHTIPLFALPGPGFYSFSATVDYGNIVNEQSEANNTDYQSVNIVVPTINLAPYGSNISGNNYLLCQNPTFNYSVRNFGLLAAGAFDVRLTVTYGGSPVLVQTQSSSGLAPNASESFSFPFTFLGTGSYQLLFEVDIPVGSGMVAESNENDNASNASINVVICEPDLSVYGCQNLYTNPQNPGFPGTLTANATIRNNGTAAALAPFDVDFNVNGSSNLLTITNDLAPGQTLAVSQNLSVPTPGQNDLLVTVDAGNDISESSEANNAQGDELCYEFYPSSYCYGGGWWNYTQVVNQPVNINCGVNSTGMYVPSTVQTRFELSGPGIAGWLNLGLALNNNLNTRCYCPTSASLPLPYLFTLAGTYQLKVTMDPNNLLIECDETNNEIIFTFQVTDRPDYRILSQYIAPSLLNPQPGEAITVDVSYENIGFSDVGSTLELFTKINNDPFDSTQVIGLATNDYLTYGFGTPWSSTLVGTHVIRAIIDHDNEIAESIETSNNEATRAIIVGEAVNFQIPSFTVTNSSPSLGAGVNFNITVKNSGDQDGTGDLLLSYVDDNLDTIPFSTTPLNILTGDSVFILVPWLVLDNSTTIVATVINANPQEATYTDNTATLQLGGFTITFETQNETCSGNDDGFAVPDISGGTPPYTYFWNDGSNNDTLFAGAGNYSLTVFDINGFSSLSSVTIGLTPDNVAPQITGIPSDITYNALTGDCPSIINWVIPSVSDNCGVNQFVSNYNPGDGFPPGITTVTYTATDGFGNNTQASFTVTVIASPAVNAGGDQTQCGNATMAAGPLPYGLGTWALISGAGVISDIHDPATTITGLAGGQNIFTWTFSNGTCPPVSDTVIITDNCSCPIITSNAVTTGTCSGSNNGSIDLTVNNGTAPYLFDWGPSNPTTEDLNNISSGLYTVTITDAVGCTGTNTFNVPSFPSIVTAEINVFDALCGGNNGSFALTQVIGGTPPYSFGYVSGIEVLDSLLTNLASGDYDLYIVDDNGCTYNAGTQTINNTDSLISFNVSVTDASCGVNNGSIDVIGITGGVGPYTVILGSLVGGTPQAGTTVNGLSPNIYDITVVDIKGCHFTQGSISVGNSSGPSSVSLSLTNESCSGSGSIEVLNVIDGIPPYEYSLDGITYQSASLFTNLVASSYTLFVRDAGLCVYTEGFSINSAGSQITNVDILLLNEPCGDDDGSFRITTVYGGTPDFQFSIDDISYQNDSTFSNLIAGTFTIYVQDSNGCTYSELFALPTASGITDLDLIITNAGCGNNDGSIVVDSIYGGGSPYTYQLDSGIPGTSDTFSSLAPGIYSITVYDDSNCTFTELANVGGSSSITSITYTTEPANCGVNDGTVRVTSITGGTAPYELSLDGIIYTTNDSIVGLAGGSYTLFVRDASLCLYTEAFVINQTSAIVLNLTGTNPSCANSNGSIDLNVAGGSSPYTYLWNTGATDEDINGLDASTNYLVSVTDALGCTATDSLSLVNSPALSLNTTSTDAGCGLNNGTINLGVISGSAPFTFAWSNGATTEDLNTLSSGTYDVIVSDANGCLAYDTIQINSTTSPVLTFLVIDETCGNVDGSIDMTITGGASPYTIVWNNGATTEDISALNDGAYSVAVIDATGCLATGGSTITDNPPASLSFVSSGENCSQSNATIDMSISGGNAPFTIVWSNGATTEDLSSLTAGLYSVTVTDIDGCVSNANETISSISGPSLSSSAIQETCSSTNGSIDLVISNGTVPYTISWSNGATDEDLTGLAAGVYSVTVTDATGCLANASETISNIAEPVLTTAQVDETCSASNGSINLTITGGTAPFSTIWNNGETTEDLNGLSASIYSVIVTDATGCMVNTPVTINNEAAATLSATGTDETCTSSNGSVDLIISGGTGPFGILWNNGSTDEDLTLLSSGTYSVTVTDNNACISTTSISINDQAAAVLSSTQINETCSSGNASIDLTVTGGTAPITFLWNNAATTEDLTDLSAGNYTVDATDNNGCISSWSVVINDAASPLATFVTTDETCTASNGSIDLTITGGTAPISISWDNGATTEDISSLAAGTYTVTLTDNNGCITSAPSSIVDQSAAVLTTSTTDETCTTTNGSVDLTISGGTAPFLVLWNNAATDEDINSLSAGIYSVQVTDNNGCVSNTNVVVINQAEPTLTATPADEVCNNANGTIDLAVTGGTAPITFLWNTGATDEDLSNLAAGIYSVDVLDGNGCLASSSYTISNIPGPAVTHTIFNETCTASNGSIDLSISSGTAPFTTNWNTGATTEDITALSAGFYDVIVQDNNGCLAYDTVLVIDASASILSAIANAETCNNNNGSIDLSLTGGTTPFTYLWSNGETTEDVNNLSQGSYQIDVVDGNGCTGSSSYVVADWSSPVVASVHTDETCSATNGAIDISITGGNGSMLYLWSNGSTTEDLTALTAGTYDVVITDSIGCMAFDTISVSNQAGPTAFVVTTTNATCNNANGSADINSIVGGTNPFSYAFDGVTLQALDSIGGILQGTYTALISDVNGCTFSQSYTINQDPLPVAGAGNDTTICLNDTATLIASGGVSYVWNNGAGSGQNVSVSPATNTLYTVTVTDINGCTAQDSVLVSINALPLQPVISSSGGFAFCFGNSLTLVSSYSGGNTWNNGTSNDSTVVNTGGTYILTYTDLNGCSNSDTAVVTENPLPVVSLNGTPDICENAGSIILSNGTPAGGVYAGVGITGSLFNPSGIVPGVVGISYTFTDANGCTNLAHDSLEIFAKPSLSIINDTLNFCFGNDPSLVANVIPDGGLYYGNGFISDSLTFDPNTLTEGVYSSGYLYTDGNGCSNFVEFRSRVGNINVTIPDNLSGIENQPFPVFAELDYYRGAADVTYQWTPVHLFNDPTSSNPLITVNDSTTITVTITDGYCTAESSARVVVVEENTTIVISTSSPGSGDYEYIIDNGNDPVTATLELYNEAGRLIRTNQIYIPSGRSRHPFSISELSNGAYFSRIYMGKIEKKHQLIKAAAR